MTSIGRSLLPLALLVVASAAPAQASSVLVARIDATGIAPERVEALDAALRAEARGVVRDRLLSSSPARPEGCGTDELCAAALAGQHGATVVVVPAYAVVGDDHRLQVSLYDQSGRLVATAVRALSAPPDFDVWRGVVVQLLSPESYVGHLRFQGVPADANVSVDRVPLSRAELAAPFVVGAGKHVVDVTAPGRVALRREVEVAFGEVVNVNAAMSPEAASAGDLSMDAFVPPVPWWPAAVTGGVASVSAITALVAAVDWFGTSQAVAAENASLQFDDSWDGHAYAVSVMPDALERTRILSLRAALRNDVIIMSAAGTIALVAGAASAALLTRWALADNDEEEAP